MLVFHYASLKSSDVCVIFHAFKLFKFYWKSAIQASNAVLRQLLYSSQIPSRKYKAVEMVTSNTFLEYQLILNKFMSIYRICKVVRYVPSSFYDITVAYITCWCCFSSNIIVIPDKAYSKITLKHLIKIKFPQQYEQSILYLIFNKRFLS